MLGINVATCLLDTLNQRLSLHNLLAHIVHRALQNQSLGATLPFQTRHELSKPVEALANGLTAFLFCGATLAFGGRWNAGLPGLAREYGIVWSGVGFT